MTSQTWSLYWSRFAAYGVVALQQRTVMFSADIQMTEDKLNCDKIYRHNLTYSVYKYELRMFV